MKPETVITADGKEVVLIHLVRDGRIVCMPNLAEKDMSSNRERAAPHIRTDFIGGVTCPMCRKAK